MIGSYEKAELNEADELPPADDYASHAALLLTQLEQATFNSYSFQGQGPRQAQSLGPATPVDVAGLDFRTAAGFLEQQLAAHPTTAVLAATDYRIAEVPVNMTFKRLLASRVKPVRKASSALHGYQAPGRIPVDFGCLARTKPLQIVAGLNLGSAQHSAFLSAMRGMACVVVEDTVSATFQLWFRVYAQHDHAQDLVAMQHVFDAVSSELNADGGEGGVYTVTLDARQRGRFLLPLGRMRVHYWAFGKVKPDVLVSRLTAFRQSARERKSNVHAASVLDAVRAVKEAPRAGHTVGPVSGLPVLDMTDGKCRWHPANTSCEVLGT